ncbi:MAG: hypothetical protein JWN40_4701 [Phycisphaerales bacterium]|nr:hypothetical protein [Phycisphaerales bacterium]
MAGGFVSHGRAVGVIRWVRENLRFVKTVHFHAISCIGVWGWVGAQMERDEIEAGRAGLSMEPPLFLTVGLYLTYCELST